MCTRHFTSSRDNKFHSTLCKDVLHCNLSKTNEILKNKDSNVIWLSREWFAILMLIKFHREKSAETPSISPISLEMVYFNIMMLSLNSLAGSSISPSMFTVKSHIVWIISYSKYTILVGTKQETIIAALHLKVLYFRLIIQFPQVYLITASTFYIRDERMLSIVTIPILIPTIVWKYSKPPFPLVDSFKNVIS